MKYSIRLRRLAQSRIRLIRHRLRHRRPATCRPPARRRLPDRMLACACLIPLLAMAGKARSADAPPDELAQEQLSVRELMRLDTALALRQARNKLDEAGRAAPASAGPAAFEPGPRLLAIYGVGKKLTAELRIGSATLVYLRGHPLPIGQSGAGKSTYFLRDMTPACVSLERDARPLRLCLGGSQLAGG